VPSLLASVEKEEWEDASRPHMSLTLQMNLGSAVGVEGKKMGSIEIAD
jgi:hypothetical protein